MDWCCIAAVNDTTVLESNLAASPTFRSEPDRLCILRNRHSASIAYNEGLDQTKERICVFAHQDVYLPLGWEETLMQKVSDLETLDPNWAVIGLFGVDLNGGNVGRVWDSGIGREIGFGCSAPIPVQSFDELLLVLNRDCGLRFDPDLPSFHLYGTDIVQTAISSGKRAYVIDAPVVHNSLPVPTLRGGFTLAYNYMRKKWWERLPIVTPVTRLTRRGWYLEWQDIRRFRFNSWRKNQVRLASRQPRPNPETISKRLGYE
ncbi:hypothetical protein [Rhodosalinus sp. FB01]|uniref:hypothetical protein n=1 Tax=Rhodosalinus sp. FB01 TaxID=3239194 RepID=UPI0035249529